MPRAYRDLTGLRFGHLEVISEAVERASRGRRMWNVRCDCGTEKIVRRDDLTKKETMYSRSKWVCERKCPYFYDRDPSENPHTLTRSSFKMARQRVTCSTRPDWYIYGGAGVTMHPSWINNYSQFVKDVGLRMHKGLSLDRYPNPYGNYEPGNVRWATSKEQAVNKRAKASKAA